MPSRTLVFKFYPDVIKQCEDILLAIGPPGAEAKMINHPIFALEIYLKEPKVNRKVTFVLKCLFGCICYVPLPAVNPFDVCSKCFFHCTIAQEG